MPVTAWLALAATIISLIVNALSSGGTVDWEALIIKILQAIYAGVPGAQWAALIAFLQKESNAALAGLWNALVAWSKVHGPTHGFECADYWVEVPAPGFPVPGPTDPGQPGP